MHIGDLVPRVYRKGFPMYIGYLVARVYRKGFPMYIGYLVARVYRKGFPPVEAPPLETGHVEPVAFPRPFRPAGSAGKAPADLSQPCPTFEDTQILTQLP